MSHFPFIRQAFDTMGTFNVYRSTIDLGSAAQQSLFTTLPQLGDFCPVQVWIHIESISPSPSQLTMNIGTVAAPAAISSAVNITPLVQFSSFGINTVVGNNVVASRIAPSTAVVFQSTVRPTSGSATLFVSGFYIGVRDGR